MVRCGAVRGCLDHRRPSAAPSSSLLQTSALSRCCSAVTLWLQIQCRNDCGSCQVRRQMKPQNGRVTLQPSGGGKGSAVGGQGPDILAARGPKQNTPKVSAGSQQSLRFHLVHFLTVGQISEGRGGSRRWLGPSPHRLGH